MSNPNWNKDTNAGRNSKGGVKGNVIFISLFDFVLINFFECFPAK